MCGLVGLVNIAGVSEENVGRNMDAALERLAPRGPDGMGRWADDQCILGHRRLAVIDLSDDAAQPMERDGVVITYNGEIYNFKDVRRSLEELGQRFSTNSDTEVLLAGWRVWGERLFEKLVGMFALAIWDQKTRELILARDRYGKKPLLYRHEGGRMVFGSDLVAMYALAPDSCDLDEQALRLFFSLRFIPEPWSIIRQIKKLPSGHLAVFRGGDLDIRPWYRLDQERPKTFRSEDQAIARVREVFDRAVMDRLVADVPVGAFLSGGIDSSLVVASLAAQGQKVTSYTVGFAGASNYYEERPAARRVAEYLGMEHMEVEVGPDDARNCLEDVLAGCDEPFADSSALPQFLLARETRKNVTVALSGDGADEVFGGYRKYQGELFAETYRHIPRGVRTGLIEPVIRMLPEGKDSRLLETFRKLRRFAAEAGKPAVERQAGWMRLLSESELAQLLGNAGKGVTVETLVSALREKEWGDPLNAMLAADIGIGLPGDMLAKVDRMSMANSLEVRSPFLDQRVVECALAMPGRFKIQKGRGKAILRMAFADRLPKEVFGLPKKGFEVPIAQWLVGDLRDRTRAVIEPDRLERQGLFNSAIVQGWFDDLDRGRRDTSWHLWAMIAFQTWMDGHGRRIGVSMS